MNNDVKVYLKASETVDNIQILKKMLTIITLNDVNVSKILNVYEINGLKQDGLAKLINCIHPLKNDLKLDYLSLIIVPEFKEEFIKLIDVKETKVYYLFELIVDKIKNNNINVNILASLFKNVPDNIIDTVKQYIVMNQSVINTSEAMFTHRNTINYRLNKFIELTGINVRETSSAMTTYLLLTLLNK